MRKSTTYLTFVVIGLVAFMVGHWSRPVTTVKADTGETPLISVQPVRGDTGLTIYYPSLKKLFVYQSPFIGMPTWNCAYSVQLTTPGGPIERQPCPSSGQVIN